MTVQLEVMIADLNGHQEVRENLLLAVMLVQAATLLVQVQIQDHLVESGLQKDQLVMSELLVVSGLLRDLLVMIVHHVVMTEHLAESGHQNALSVMTVHQDASGLLKDHSAMTVLQEENGLIQDQRVMTEVQEILVDQIVWKEMTTVREVSMVQETSLLTRKLSLKMLF